MNKIKNVAIYGSCISKGPFTTLFNPDYKIKYKCIIDDQLHSMISTMQEKEEYNEKDIILSPNNPRNNLIYKSIKQDLEKSFIEAVKINKIDYLVFDIYFDVRSGILQYNENKIMTNIKDLNKTTFYKKLNNQRELNILNNPSAYFNLWKEYCDKFFKFMKEESPETVIVLAEVRALDTIQKDDSTTYIKNSFTETSKILNNFFKKFEEYIKNTQEVYVIKFNENTLLKEKHVWGQHYAHYFDEYYRRFLTEMDKINQFEELKKELYFTSKSSNSTDVLNKNDTITNFKQNYDELKNLFDKNEVELFNIKDELLMYRTARVDLINWGSNVGVELKEINDDEYNTFNTIWLDKNKASGIIIESNKKYIEFKIRCIGNGLLKIYLRSMDKRDKNGKRFPIFIDFEKLTINDTIIFDENKLITHDYPYIFEKNVSDNEILTVMTSWSAFNNKSELRSDLYGVGLYDLKNELIMYRTARVDLINWGSNVGVELIEINDNEYNRYNPIWLDKNKASGIIIESNKKYLKFKIKCIGNGLLKIYLRSMDKRDKNGKKFPIFIDFEKLTINDTIIFDENKLITCHNPYIFEKNVSDHEILTITVLWSAFNNKSAFKSELN